MFKDKKILAVIPARGGSKGIPHKNLQKIGRRTLVEWAFNTAQKYTFADRIIVSSDSSYIIKKVNRIGKFAPFVRPAELAKDNSPSLPVFQHALKWSEDADNCVYNFIVVLEPTCPFRLPQHISKAVEIAINQKASSVISLVKVSDCHPVRIKRLMNDGKIEPFCIEEPEGLRRQDQEAAFIRNGAVYVFSRQTIINNQLWGDNPYGFEMEKSYYSINIDEPFDLLMARHVYNEFKKKGILHYIDSTVNASAVTGVTGQ